MRLLLDANVSPRVALLLTVAGIEATHVRDHGLHHAEDTEIVDYAVTADHVLVSEDTDFGGILAAARTTAPSVVLLRSAEPLPPDEQAALLARNLPAIVESLRAGALVVLARGRIRVRPLPLHGRFAEPPPTSRKRLAALAGQQAPGGGL